MQITPGRSLCDAGRRDGTETIHHDETQTRNAYCNIRTTIHNLERGAFLFIPNQLKLVGKMLASTYVHVNMKAAISGQS